MNGILCQNYESLFVPGLKILGLPFLQVTSKKYPKILCFCSQTAITIHWATAWAKGGIISTPSLRYCCHFFYSSLSFEKLLSLMELGQQDLYSRYNTRSSIDNPWSQEMSQRYVVWLGTRRGVVYPTKMMDRKDGRSYEGAKLLLRYLGKL